MNYKYCLATVTSRNFYKGTCVMVSSFLRKNPWFDGDIVLISDEIKIANKITTFKRIKVLTPGEELIKKTQILGRENPLLKSISRRFYVFEIFRLFGYGRVVCLDSDMVIRGNIRELFYCKELICAPPDPAVFLNKVIKKSTYKRVFSPETPDSEHYFLTPFSSGILSVHQSLINNETYHSLINKINPDFYRNLSDTIADGYILNHVFSSNIHLLGPEYNYIIHLGKAISKNSSVSFKEGLILHYTGPLKPWKVINQLKLLYRSKSYINYLFIWNMEYLFSLLNHYI